VQRFAFAPGDELAAISATQSVTYFVVATLEPTASDQIPASFQIVFDPDAASVVRDRANGATVSINDTQPITIGPVRAAGPTASLGVVAYPTSIIADGVSTSVVTVTVLDAHGQWVVDGTSVTFTTTLGTLPANPYVTSTSSGLVTTVLTSSTSAGTALITASADSHFMTAVVTFTAGSPHHVAISPPVTVLTPVATQAFVAATYDRYDNVISGLTYTWTVVNGGGTIDASGVFTAGTAPGAYANTVRATANGVSGTASVTVTVGALDHVVVSPPSVTLVPGGIQPFAAAGYDQYSNVISGLTYTWTVVNGGGTVDASGVFTAGTAPGAYANTVRATANGVSGTASVTVTVGALDHVVVSPPSVTLVPGGIQPFAAAGYDRYENVVSGLTYTWTVANGGGTIDASGVFTAGTVPGAYPNTVQATANGVSGYATVVVEEEWFYTFLPLISRDR
jgi:hypothetical protein